MGRKPRADGSMSLRQFAEHIGKTHPAVIKAMQEGRLVKSVVFDAKDRPRILPKLGKEEWEHNTDHERNRNAGAGGRPKGAAPTLFPEAEELGGAPTEAKSGLFQNRSLTQWRSMQVALATRREQLDLQEREGALIKTETVRSEWFNLVRLTRDLLLLIPDRIAGLVAAEAPGANEKKIRAIVDSEIRQALTSLGGDGTRP